MDQISAWNAETIELIREGRLEEALARCEQILEQEPDHIEAAARRAVLLQETDRQPEAIAAYRELARAHAGKGDFLKAISATKSLLSLDPEATQAVSRELADIYTKQYAPRQRQTPSLPPASPLSASNQESRTDPLLQDLYSQFESMPTPVSQPSFEEEEEASLESTAPEVSVEAIPLGEERAETFSLAETLPSEPAIGEEEDSADKTVMELSPHGATAPALLPPLFSNLEAEAFAAILDRMVRLHIQDGEVLIRQGDEGETFYLICEGEVRVTHWIEDSEEELGLLGAGQFFGEIALLTPLRRTATVTAKGDCELLALTHADLNEVMASHPYVREELQRFVHERLISNLLTSSVLFFPLPDNQRLDLARQFAIEIAPAGSPLIEEGKSADGLYLIAAGELDIYKTRPDGEMLYLESLGPGQFFGELSLLTDSVSMNSITPRQDATLLKLDGRVFMSVMRHYPRVLDVLRAVAQQRYQEMKALSDLWRELTPSIPPVT